MSQTELTCQELVELVTEYFEDALPSVERERFEKHLKGCEGCQAYLQQMEQTIRLTGQLTEASMPESAKQALLETFRRWRSEA
jgi:anti-sigma factor RsiW